MSLPALETAADRLRTLVDALAARLTDAARVVTDTEQDCDPQRPDTSFLRLYQVRGPRRADAADVLTAISAELGADGWSTTDRSTGATIALQAGRDGADLGVTLATTAAGDVVVGGSTACFPAATG